MTRTSMLHLVLLSAFASLFVIACAGGPKYPTCDNDEHCAANAEGSPITEYCVQKTCQQCRETANCATGEQCNAGRCDPIAGWCAADANCSAEQVCQSNRCVDAPECAANEDCASGFSCDAGSCVEADECSADIDCGAGSKCEYGKCINASTQISRACMPTSNAGDVIELQVVAFEFNQEALTFDAQNGLDTNADCLRQAPDIELVIEGHADDRGTQEYNLGLGQRRADAVAAYLKNLGLGNNVRTVSKGENEPLCHQATDACHSQNRRVKFIQRTRNY